MPSSFHTSGHTNEPTGVGYSHDERDEKKDVTSVAETVDAGLHSDEASDISPGGLTFEEGLSVATTLPSRNLSDM